MKKIKPGARVRVFSAGGHSTSRVSDSKSGSASRKGRSSPEAARGEGNSSFEGLVIARKHGSEPGATFTVRAIRAGVGVEKIYPLHSPAITKVEIISSPKKVHRAKLYFVRGMPAHRIRKKIGVSV